MDRLAVGNVKDDSSPRASFYVSAAIERARNILRWDADIASHALFETRIRLAIHLAPRTAIAYDRSNPTPRWKLIRQHLFEAFGRAGTADIDELARDLAKVLDTFDSEREQVTSRLSYLLKHNGAICQSCRVEFFITPKTLNECDEYKPYYLSPEELLKPEVDHIDAISALGTNALNNLQLLCRLCNQGKGDGLGLSVREEIRNSGFAINSMSAAYRGRLLYYVLLRDARVCTRCHTVDAELTIRPVVSTGALVRSNMRTVCTKCCY
ncbi:HNH endonuclease signature motif containing protein [Mycobacterium sp. URHB0044]|uniref:HNH endonuclease signature motif containing protein n=1 Tax=Mycobacterium sp. URHB0044 TaxID=1380386 RepID=UPI00351079C3